MFKATKVCAGAPKALATTCVSNHQTTSEVHTCKTTETFNLTVLQPNVLLQKYPQQTPVFLGVWKWSRKSKHQQLVSCLQRDVSHTCLATHTKHRYRQRRVLLLVAFSTPKLHGPCGGGTVPAFIVERGILRFFESDSRWRRCPYCSLLFARDVQWNPSCLPPLPSRDGFSVQSMWVARTCPPFGSKWQNVKHVEENSIRTPWYI